MSTARTSVSRTTPRISVNKLGEYLVASAARRRGILRDQKAPKDFVVMTYTEATTAIAEHLAAASANLAVIDRMVTRLRATTTTTKYDKQRIKVCLEALAAFTGMAAELDFGAE